MAYFKLNTFGGLAPRISPRLLGDTLAQTATDVNLESGRLVPITDNSTTDPSNGVSTLASTTTLKKTRLLVHLKNLCKTSLAVPLFLATI